MESQLTLPCITASTGAGWNSELTICHVYGRPGAASALRLVSIPDPVINSRRPPSWAGDVTGSRSSDVTHRLCVAGGNTGGSFSVLSQGGVVIARPLDWETTPEYTLNISATDGHHVVYTPVSG